MTKQEFIDYIKSLTVLELADLVHAVEEEFRVSAQASAVAVAGPAAAVEEVEEKTEFDVVLKSFDTCGIGKLTIHDTALDAALLGLLNEFLDDLCGCNGIIVTERECGRPLEHGLDISMDIGFFASPIHHGVLKYEIFNACLAHLNTECGDFSDGQSPVIEHDDGLCLVDLLDQLTNMLLLHCNNGSICHLEKILLVTVSNKYPPTIGQGMK